MTATVYLSRARLQRIWEDAVQREEDLKRQQVPRATLRQAHREVMHAYGTLQARRAPGRHGVAEEEQ